MSQMFHNGMLYPTVSANLKFFDARMKQVHTQVNGAGAFLHNVKNIMHFQIQL